jgi:uncharacterized damage-inducible protein DinB
LSSETLAPAFPFPLEALRDHWQGHRRLTRRVIEAFPEKELFSYSVGGMRPFAALALEMVSMTAGGMRGLATGAWPAVSELTHHRGGTPPDSREALFRAWDEATAEIEAWWPKIPADRLVEVDKAFGEWEGPIYGILLYWIDNEIHHRGQGYVYLRSLGIAPPAFYER